jgi:DNA-binding response OmpR family regulator
VARIAVVAKRSAEVGTKTNKILSLGGVSVDNKARVATVGGAEVKFTKTEFDLLEYFIKNGKNVIRRESLMKDIIGYENYIYDRTIDTHVKNLRKKI